VVIHDFDVARAAIAVWPLEANPPLVVDADAVLVPAISPQRFEAISREATKRLQMRGGFQPVEAYFRLPPEVLKGPDILALGKFTRPFVSVAKDREGTHTKRRITSSVSQIRTPEFW
jgi:hypothetical protein